MCVTVVPNMKCLRHTKANHVASWRAWKRSPESTSRATKTTRILTPSCQRNCLSSSAQKVKYLHPHFHFYHFSYFLDFLFLVLCRKQPEVNNPSQETWQLLAPVHVSVWSWLLRAERRVFALRFSAYCQSTHTHRKTWRSPEEAISQTLVAVKSGWSFF